MTTYFGKIDVYFVNVLSPKAYNGKRLMNVSGSFGKAILWFYPDDSPLPDNSKRASHDVFYVYYYMNTWEPLLDIPRNEEPVHFSYYDGGKLRKYIPGRSQSEKER